MLPERLKEWKSGAATAATVHLLPAYQSLSQIFLFISILLCWRDNVVWGCLIVTAGAVAFQCVTHAVNF